MSKTLYILGIIILLSSWQELFGQISYVRISGPASSDLDGQKTYEAVFYNSSNGIESPPTTGYDAFWHVPSGGTVVIQSDFSVTVRWIQSGTQNLQFDLTTWDNYYYDDFDVMVSGIGVVTPNLNPATSITTNSFVASWGSATGAASYLLDIGLDYNFNSFFESYHNYPLTAINEAISGLTPGITYYYRVRAVNSTGTISAYSNSMSAQTVTTAPVLAQATTTATSFTANWGAVTGAKQYSVEVAENSSFSPNLRNFSQISGTSFTVNNLIQSTEYYYRVKAFNNSGYGSVYSQTASVTTATGPPPVPVATAATNFTSSSFQANWSAAATATGYRLDVSTTSDFTNLVDGYDDFPVSPTNAIVTGLMARTNYYYRVRSANQYGNSDNSETILAANFDRNFIKVVDVTVSGKTTLNQVDSATLDERITSINFFDGLGRPEQTVQVQSSPLQNDIVQPIVYDVYGREVKKYLPYTAVESNGFYKPVAYTETGDYTHNFYDNPSDAIADDTRPFNEIILEASPLNRPLKEYGPGVAWGPEANNKFVEYQYETNRFGTDAGQERIIAWKLDDAEELVREEAVAGYIEDGGYYSTGQLYVKVTIDEHGNAVREYTNKQGQVILKKVQVIANSTALNSVAEWACTYYVYDDHGNLVSVLPPEATKSIVNAAQY